MTPLSQFWEGYRAGEKAPRFTHCKACEEKNATEWLFTSQVPNVSENNKSGAQRCRNILCPYCHAGRVAKSRAQMNAHLKLAKACGYSLSLITLTLEHDAALPLSAMINALQGCYAKTRHGSPFARLKRQTGLVGVLNVLEVTYSAHGWNPHFHVVIIADGDQSSADKAAKAVCARYEAQLKRQGYRVSQETTNQRLVYNIDGLCRYLFKNWHNVEAKQDNQGKTPFDLARAGLRDDAVSRSLFVEYECAMRGRRQAILTPNLKKELSKNVQ